MNNFRKSLKELFQVNNQAGILRIFLAAAFTFVLWSLFAVISASFDPSGSLDLPNVLGINSENLALSLFLDIINAYFSIFSVSFTLLFLLVALLSLETTAFFLSHIKSSPSKGSSKNYLTSCAFSFPRRKKFLFPDDQINSSGDILTGPLEAVIKPGYALLVGNWPIFSVKFNNVNNPDNLEVFLSFKEMVIDCFTLDPSSFSFEFEDITFSKTFLIELAYSFILPTGTENTVRFANMLALFDSGNIRKIIESVLMSETKIAISQYVRNSPELSDYPLSRVQEGPIENNKSTQRFLTFINKLRAKVIKEIEKDQFI